MALTEEQLEIISEALQPLFQYLEKEVITDIARRIQKTLTYSRTAELQAMSMREMGYSPAKIREEAMKLLNADSGFRKAVAKNTLEYKREVRGIINSITKEAYKANDQIVAGAGNMAWVNDLAVWKDAGKELADNSFLQQLIQAFADQTAGELKNMTRTTGFKTMSGYEAVENAYKRELDKAVIKVCSGTFSRDKVVQDVVHDLAQSGLRSIDFTSGYSMQLDTAARLALRTGCHQLAGKVTDKNIKQTGENLVYVSKHWGARNTGAGHANHEQWQGKIYFIQGGQDYSAEARRIGQDRIMDLWYATGYSADGSRENDPLGLNGYNCRHNHHPWFEGVSSIPKESPEPKPVTINGKTYDYYAMTQKQRSMERAVRALKREKEALKALGMDTTEIQARISRKTREYKEFCGICGINPRNGSLRYECGTADLKKTEAWKAYEQKRTLVGGDMSGLQEIIPDDTIKVEEPKPTHTVVNRPIIEQDAVIEQAKIYGDDLLQHSDLIQYGNGDPITDYVNRKLGYNKLPRIVSEDEFELLKREKQVLYRGVTNTDSMSSREMIDAFKHGEFFAGRGVYGYGTYTDADKRVAEYYAREKGEGEIIEMLLGNDAKTVDFVEIFTEYEKTGIPKIIGEKPEAYQDIIGNLGTYASIKGYDAILLNGFQNKYHVVILNRSKVIVKE